jgi:hypothetical protein
LFVDPDNLKIGLEKPQHLWMDDGTEIFMSEVDIATIYCGSRKFRF